MPIVVKYPYQPETEVEVDEVNHQIRLGMIDVDKTSVWNSASNRWVPLKDHPQITKSRTRPLIKQPKSEGHETVISTDHESNNTPTAPASSEKVDANIALQPWRRLFAFFIDLAVTRFVLEITAIILFFITGFITPYETEPFKAYPGTFFVFLLLHITLTVILLSTAGNTLGRLLLGYRIKSHDTNKLPLKHSIQRTIMQVGRGSYLLLWYPFLTWAGFFYSYNYVKKTVSHLGTEALNGRSNLPQLESSAQ